jgi:hypothetical protein
LAECVAFNGFSFSDQGWHPLAQAGAEYLQNGVRRYEGSCLEQFFDNWRPRNALEALNGSLTGPAALGAIPAFARVVPWSNRSLEESAAYMARIIEIENQAFGAPSLGPSDGYGLHGPVSPKKGTLEYLRLVDLIDSIRRKGYSRTGGDITVEVLHRSGRFRYVIVHGHHRSAALVALGKRHAPVIPEILVEREHVDHWPAVYQGWWSRAEALAYFDHLFEFDSASWARERGLVP